MKKINAAEVIKKSKVTKIDREDINLFMVDLTPAGFALTIEVEASDATEAKEKATKHIENDISNGSKLPTAKAKSES